MSSTLTSSSHRDEGAEAGRVEDARHADDPLAREPGRLLGDVGHYVQRVGDHDHDRIGRHPGDLGADRAHDPGVGTQKIVAAHSRLAGDPRRHDEEIGPLRGAVCVRSRDHGVEAFDRRALPLVEALPLWNALDDVDEHDFPAQLLLGEPLGAHFADVPGADYGDLSG